MEQSFPIDPIGHPKLSNILNNKLTTGNDIHRIERGIIERSLLMALFPS